MGRQLAVCLARLADAPKVARMLSGTRLSIDRYLDETVLARLLSLAALGRAAASRGPPTCGAIAGRASARAGGLPRYGCGPVIRHALAGEMELAALWIENSATSMVNRSDVRTLSRWIARLPPTLEQKGLRLRLEEAWALALSLQTAEAARA